MTINELFDKLKEKQSSSEIPLYSPLQDKVGILLEGAVVIGEATTALMKENLLTSDEVEKIQCIFRGAVDRQQRLSESRIIRRTNNE